jgi:hypothetical protein
MTLVALSGELALRVQAAGIEAETWEVVCGASPDG